MNREELCKYLDWLRAEVIPGYEQQLSDQADRNGGLRNSIQRVRQQIRDIEWRLETEPPRPEPLCGWTKPYAEHTYPCPKNSALCNQAHERWLKKNAGKASVSIQEV